MRSECPSPRPDCKYAPECFADTDHVVPQRLARAAGATALAKLFIHHEVNKQQLCRREHDEKTADGDAPLPSNEEMIEAIVNSGVHLSKRKQKIIDQYRRQ